MKAGDFVRDEDDSYAEFGVIVSVNEERNIIKIQWFCQDGTNWGWRNGLVSQLGLL